MAVTDTPEIWVVVRPASCSADSEDSSLAVRLLIWVTVSPPICSGVSAANCDGVRASSSV